MIIFRPDQVGPLRIDTPISRNAKKLVSWLLRPFPWAAYMPIYRTQVVAASVPNGAMYYCKRPGVMGATEPEWTTDPEVDIESGAAIFRARPYSALLAPDDILTLVSFSSVGCSLDNQRYDDFSAEARYLSIAADPAIEQISITLHAEWENADAVAQMDEKTIVLPLLDP